MSNVPQAKPVYLDIHGREVPEPAGAQDTHRETKWHNPTDKVVVVEIFVGTPQARGENFPPRNYEERYGIRKYVFKPGETKSIDSDYDNGIQQVQCKHPECITRPFACRIPDHIVKEIVGGQAPMLENMGLIHRPTMARALDDEQARMDAAERAEFEVFKRQKLLEQEAARARAERDIANQRLEERAKAEAQIKQQREMADLEAATAPAQKPQQPKK